MIRTKKIIFATATLILFSMLSGCTAPVRDASKSNKNRPPDYQFTHGMEEYSPGNTISSKMLNPITQ